ncbi:hypothetical protein WR25_26115 isoform A [Diploscapter pachys]|uniref:Uncharacterized protein n=1 Tax=Diploscapter pachys TaxID=2018661 RepID=A0A2A2J5T5_9BILA|nr:hypothetical protein WR25_26115 isoform A [Diploscapter pachys]
MRRNFYHVSLMINFFQHEGVNFFNLLKPREMWSSIALLGFAAVALADVDYNYQVTPAYIDKCIARMEKYNEKGVVPDYIFDAVESIKNDEAAKQALCDLTIAYHGGKWDEGVPHNFDELMEKVKEVSQTLYDLGVKVDATYRERVAMAPQTAQNNATKWEAIMYQISNPNREIAFCNFLEKGPEFAADMKKLLTECQNDPAYKEQLLKAFPTLSAVYKSDEFKAAQAFFGSEAAMKTIDCKDPKTLERLAKMFKMEDMVPTKPPQ